MATAEEDNVDGGQKTRWPFTIQST